MNDNNDVTYKTFPLFKQLGDLSIESFLKDYWQKKPLLIRQAFPNFEPSISPDELAGFALEDDVVSRLIVEKNAMLSPHASWEVEHGPLDAERFASLPKSNWTLLVQNADQLDPEINALLNAFRFIPNWRLDDIMVSYASDKGGVGPHFDYFDVFLLQAQGRRRWRIGQECDVHSPLVPDQSMKVLQDFHISDEWICEPGDLLYIPAKRAHWGEAEGECITYSIGFRAPSDSDFLLDFSQECSAVLTEDMRYTDPALKQQDQPGEITDETLEKFKNKLANLLGDKRVLAKWLAEFATQNTELTDEKSLYEILHLDDYDHLIESIEEEYEEDISLKLASYHRCVFLPESLINKDGSIDCYVNGCVFKVSLSLAKLLSSYTPFLFKQLDKQQRQQLRPLVEDELIEISG